MTPRIPYLEERLLVEAAEIIETEGIDALSLRALGRRAGVSRAAPYHYFKDKADLLTQIGIAGFTRLGERIEDAVRPHPDPRGRLRAGLAAYVAFAQDEGHFFHLMFSGDLTRPGMDVIDGSRFPFSSDAARATFELLIRGVRDAQRAGALRPGDPQAIVNVFWSFAHGLAVLARGAHLKHDGGAGAVFDVGFDAVWAGFTPEPAPR